jgi:hypothetical protein
MPIAVGLDYRADSGVTDQRVKSGHVVSHGIQID